MSKDMTVFMPISLVRPYSANCARPCRHEAYRPALTMTLRQTRNEVHLSGSESFWSELRT